MNVALLWLWMAMESLHLKPVAVDFALAWAMKHHLNYW